MPSAAEIKLFIDEAKAAYKAKTGKAPGKAFVPMWYFGDGKPLVNAYYLLDMARVFPYAETIYYSENSLTSPLYIEDGMGDALLLPMRNNNNTDEIASSPYIHKPEDVFPTESNVRSYKAPKANETVQALLHETDGQRAERLSNTTLNVAQYDGANESFTEAEAEALEAKTKRDARKYVQTLLEKFNVLKSYTNANTQIEFDFNKSGFSESLSTQSVRNKSMTDFAKMLSVMDSVVENAIPIESHSDKYVGTKREDRTLNQAYVFLSAFQDVAGIAPVQLEVKEYNDGRNSTLYLAVTMDKIKAEVSGGDPITTETVGHVLPPRSANISIPEIISKINPSDGAFLKYIPDSMLSDAQKAAKQSALEAQQKKIDGMKTNPISTYRASGQAVTPNSTQPTGTPKRSPAQIAKRLADALKTGYSVGTRKIRQMPAAVQGIYENRARQIAVRSKKAGSYVVTMHETFHGLSERLGMVGNQQMIDNLDPSFAQAYTAAELPGEAFAEFGWRYMQSDELARSFAGDAFVDAFESAIRREGIADTVHQAARDMRMWLNATTNERIGAIVHDQSEKRDNRGWRQRFRDLIARNVDDTAAAEGVAKEVRKQSGKKKLDLSEDIRSNALMKNFSDRQAWNLLCGGGQTEIGDSLATRFEKAGLKAEDAPLLYSYMLALHSLDRDTQNKPVFDESITTDDRQALIRDVQANHPEVAAAEQAFQAFRTELLQYFLVDSGRMTQAELDALNKMYPHYVPTMRVKEPPHNSRIHTKRKSLPSTKAKHHLKMLSRQH